MERATGSHRFKETPTQHKGNREIEVNVTCRKNIVIFSVCRAPSHGCVEGQSDVFLSPCSNWPSEREPP